ncbi:MAG: phosphate ABC transporter permease subunit PstC, partial [Acidimicrobiia bacterium]
MTALDWDITELQGSKRRRGRENRVKATVFSAALTSILLSLLIIGSLLFEAIGFITNVDLSQLWDLGWFPRRDIFDLKTLIVATLWVTLIAMLVAAPLGLAAAVYLSEYATPRVRKVLKPVLEILAGIPSVVLGFFALRFINPNLVRSWLENANSSGNMIAAGIGVGILTIPLVASVAEDSLSAVPDSLREASAGVGARKVTTTLSIVVPAALSGLVAAFILATSRAIGETMVVFIAGGAADTALFSANPQDQGLTMTAAMASVAAGTDEVAGSGNAFASLFFVGAILFAVTMT